MNKAFVREGEGDEDDDPGPSLKLPPGTRNYITPAGHARLKDELEHLVKRERPHVVEIVAWAASNGDRSENGDYIYGKRRLREIDRRIRFLTKRLEIAEVADPSAHHGKDQIFFGATVTYATAAGDERTVTIKGIDEADSLQGEVSWISPIARALLKAREGDEVQVPTPGPSSASSAGTNTAAGSRAIIHPTWPSSNPDCGAPKPGCGVCNWRCARTAADAGGLKGSGSETGPGSRAGSRGRPCASAIPVAARTVISSARTRS